MSVLGGGLRGSLLSLWDSLRGSYWLLPTLMVGVSACAAIGLIELDARLASADVRRLPWVQDTGPEGTRALLQVVAGSMITVTGVVFSITIVALTLASSQFGPRLLRNFLRDRGNQLVLGTFVSTFLYSLLVLRSVQENSVPYVATAVALALAVTSVFVLIYFVHHAARSIQASSIISGVACEIETELPTLFPERLGRDRHPGSARQTGAPPRLDRADAHAVLSDTTGYVRVLDSDEILGLATERKLRVVLAARPGDFVTEGGRLAELFPATDVGEELETRVRDSFVIGADRSAVQDLGFLTGQLAEMAVRAMSPGINDPRTAVACVHRLGAVISAVADREMPSPDRYGEDGELRVVALPTTFEDIVAGCLDPIRRYGAKDAELVEAVLIALASAAERCPEPSRRETLLEHAREWVDGFRESAGSSARDRARVDAALACIEKVIPRTQVPLR